ncbi:MAG: hypothetical protein HY906_00110, partial [Deltaproteobacteria bacterium]|nr:hypothetical protein [Deltaproteobacteria bacterium]
AAATERLRLPPDDRTRLALEDLRSEAKGGNQAARTARALYLLDLFDHARFAAAPASRKLLFEEVGGSSAAPGGEMATQWVAERLDAELKRIAEPGREVLAARALVAVEVAGADADRVKLAAAVKQVARDLHSPLRANALLRLYGYCARALRDATTAPRPERPRMANHCLYTLYDSDPSAYFSDDPEQRPPDPPWTAYRTALIPLLDEVRRTGSRLGPVAEKLAAADRRFFADLVPTALPLPLDVASAGLPAAPGAPLWDRTPLCRLERDGVSVGGTPIVDDARLRSELAVIITQDPRRTLTVIAGANEPAQRVLRLAEAARKSGARVLELGVAQPVTLKVPAGDYWAGRKVARLGVLPLALAPLGQGPGAPPRDDPRAASWDPARDELGLTLTVDDTYVLTARDGLVARVRADREALRAALRRVQRAFPDQSALAIALGERPTYADLVAAVLAARSDERGAPLFPALALRSAPPRPGGSIEARVARRAAGDGRVARVLKPAARLAVAALEQQVRRCYLAAADRKGAVLGQLDYVVEARGIALARKRRTRGVQARDRALQACVKERLEQARPMLKGIALGEGSSVHVELLYFGCRGAGIGR